jgi:hypothetical protein
MQLIQYCHASSFSTLITNYFIGEEFCLGQTSIDGYKAMGFDVTILTQDEKQSLFTIKINMPISLLVYGDSFLWAKYGHHILPPSLDLTSLNKGSLRQTFWESLIQFLCTDLDGNLSSTLNPLPTSRLNQYLSGLQGGLSETANKGKIFDQQMLHQKSKQIPLSIFINLFRQRFEKHSMLESTLEILQQFYIQVETQSEECHLFGWRSFHIHVTV